MAVFWFPTLEGPLHGDLAVVRINGSQARSSRRRAVNAEWMATHPGSFTHKFRGRPFFRMQMPGRRFEKAWSISLSGRLRRGRL